MARILIVDDQEENLYLLRVLLEGHGHEVEAAHHGAEALIRARAHPPDLVISDLLMPVMDGYTLLRHWKADTRLRTAPFVVYTATYTDPEDERLALDLGADAFRVKPAEPAELVTLVGQMLSARPAAARPLNPSQNGGFELTDRHNRALIRKLGEKTLELERANRELAQDIADRVRTEQANRSLLRDLGERVKELGALRSAASILQDAPGSTAELLGRIAALLPAAMEHPERAFARVAYGDAESVGPGLPAPGPTGSPTLERRFETSDGRRGSVAVAYRGAPAPADPVFLPEEEELLASLADMLRAHFERRRAESDLKASEERFRLLARATNDAIWDWDLASDARWWNDGFETLFGYRRDEVEPTSESWSRRIHPEDRAEVIADLRQAIDQGRESWSREYRFLRRDGRSARVLDRGHIIRDETGKPMRMIGGMTDLTERKELEARFFRAQRMESIGTLAGGIAHDLNNVLAPILMSAGLLKEGERDAERIAMLESIETSAQRGGDMVRQVLAFARGVDGRPVTLDLWPLVREVGKIVQDTFPKSIELAIDGPRDLWSLSADATQMHQVLLNLCVNARDAMPQGGRLTIRLENVVLEGDDATPFSARGQGPHVRLSVADTGQGMSEEVRERAFEPFFTTKEVGRGTGLGLSTVLSIVQSHGGFVEVESEPGRGTAFHVHLPVEGTPRSVVVADPGAAGEPRGLGELLLVVDDEEAIRELTRHSLERVGFRVLLAANGAEAVALYRRLGTEIAAVLTDMAMPVMDGPATIAALRAIDPKVRILGSSGNAPLEGLSEADGLRFVAKPYTSATLVAALRRLLDAPA